MNTAGRHILTTGQAARLCSVTPDTILKWIKSGRLEAHRTAGGHYRIKRRHLSDLELVPPRPRNFSYCWEFYSSDGSIQAKCKNCVVYRTRACLGICVRWARWRAWAKPTLAESVHMAVKVTDHRALANTRCLLEDDLRACREEIGG